jgi:hypothetical protein
METTTNRNTSKHVQGVTEFIGNKQAPRHPLLNEKDAAVVLGMKVKTLQMWRHLSKGPRYYKLGRCCRYSLADLEDYMESCTVEPMA